MSEEKKGGGGKRVAGVGIVAAALLLLFGPGRGLGLGAGNGTGVGTGTGTASETVKTESTAAENTAAESTAESVAEGKTEVVIRVHNMEIYVDETLCDSDEAVLAAVEENLKDGMSLLLQDDYADNEAFTRVEKLLDEGAYEYRTETKK